MTKHLITALFIFISISAMTGCDSSTSPAPANGVIKGFVRDSSSGAGIKDVTISATPFISNVVTDSTGYFIMTGVNNGTYTLTLRKQGYLNARYYLSVDNDTLNVNMSLIFSNLYVFSNKLLTEYFNQNSLSAMNLFLGEVVNESVTQYDMQLRDSAGTSNNFYLRSGDLAMRLAGFQTKFSTALKNPLNNSYTFTKDQFDTLSRYYTADGNIDPVRDFTEDRIPSFNPTPNMPNRVYSFWLKGRNLTPPTIGMFFLNYSFVDTVAQDQFKLIIDVKVNRGGLNLFNPNE
ncbi:MAG: carboxypeptidase-like regulatory domain-containing protein [Candidatus Kapaibacterium sp.]